MGRFHPPVCLTDPRDPAYPYNDDYTEEDEENAYWDSVDREIDRIIERKYDTD